MIAKSASNPSFVAARIGAENRARELSASLGRPIRIEWLTPPQEDGQVQAQRIAQAVKERMDGVMLSVSDARAVTPAIDDAVAHGVPVMTFDSDAPDSRRFTYCGVDDVKAGETIMEELARLVPRGAHVAVLAGNRAATNLSRRVEGVLREAARHPDIKVVGTFYTVETPEEASATVIQIDAAHPDIEGWAMVGGWALYTKTLLHDLQQDTRRRRKPVKIVSINALPPQLAYVEAGLAPVLLAQPTYLWGEIGVDAIVDKLTGKKPVAGAHQRRAGAGLRRQPRRLGASAARLGLRRRARRAAPPEVARFRSGPSLGAADTHFGTFHARLAVCFRCSRSSS